MDIKNKQIKHNGDICLSVKLTERLETEQTVKVFQIGHKFVIMSPKFDSRSDTLSSSLEINEHENKSCCNNHFPLLFLGSSMTGWKDVIEQFGGISETFVFETLIVRHWGKLK